MRLVLIHGMRQEGKDPVALRAAWEGTLLDAWQQLGLSIPKYELDMPFYGDKLDRLTRQAKGGGNVVARGGEASNLSLAEAEMIKEYAKRLGVRDSEVRTALGAEVVARGPENWEWVQAIGRVIERRVPMLGRLALSMVAQVDAYLDRPHITEAVDDIVEPALAAGPAVVVAHSLGTIISYRLLRRNADGPAVPLFMTLGSPLGIHTVARKLGAPRPIPSRVAKWVNGTDERDYVALHARLQPTSCAEGIENWTDINNRREDAHLITDYLRHEKVARAIHSALS